ncbi:MAG TPA: Gfo/Idh/MocA family oxidoreductase [Acidobacteriota bacterium]|nr:Gfo/Idh/MocA family oxidoreductase [Acidobacteriota bacterium]
MPSTDILKLVFLGCGDVTHKHSATLRRIEGVERYYASRSAGRGATVARNLDGKGAYDSYAAALDDDALDVALVATPPGSHLELTLAALEAGKHVIVEKPPFLRSTDFYAAASAAQLAGRRVFVAENYFYKPLLRCLREVLADGDIGEPLFVLLNALKTQQVDDWRDDPDLAGGGALFEGGIHWVNFAANLGLPLRAVRGTRPGEGVGLERSMLLTLEYEGPAGALLYSWEVPSLFKGLRISRIWGREGSITFESNGLFVIVRGRRRRALFPGLRDISGYRAMFEDFLDAIRSGTDPAFDLEAARRDLELVEQAYETLA